MRGGLGMGRSRGLAGVGLAVAVALLVVPGPATAQSGRSQGGRVPAKRPAGPSGAEPLQLLDEAPGGAGSAEAAAASPQEPDFAGAIIYVQGGQVVAEVPGGARPGENLIVLDEGFRRKGKVVVQRELDRQTYLVRVLGSGGVGPGNRLARETESEAISRVLREHRKESYREFVRLFPRSEYRERVSREMFRLDMEARYPEYPGSTVAGKMRLVETVSRPLPLAEARIVLDRYVIQETGGDGQFRIEGIPKLDEPVRVTMRVKSPRFESVDEVEVAIRGDGKEELSVELPVRLRPTVLDGQVVDEKGGPVSGAEVWTFPYTMETLTDDDGAYSISRRKRLDEAGAQVGPDEPLLGDDYEVYARRRGFSVEQAVIAAQSHRANEVPAIRLSGRDARKSPLPDLRVDLKQYLVLAPGAGAIPRGAPPMINP